ncbi:outer membrane lipoprotein chaperone LolA [Aliidiomarina haloalkalitolerans]|uniref:Outer-membrane lipoprotein carrier protein n=1 Tax=Aliidiomarina haloalkalitolerans TaxID=859059 RepID=A0A432VY80_9GAMM|nr:outer membrane lipoprotein chaperone LolA [Aliidiomarina haloalkalitolerans]RUO21617.1 outer membrane lipoprotein carrier protein LolA [Aliidiomarina haloalkalitolerans]
MYRIVKLLVVTSCLALSWSADANAGDIATEPSAAEKLQSRLADLRSLQGQFTQAIYEDGYLLQELEGDFVLERPARLRWVTAEPEASVMVADGETLWYYNPFIEQVTLFKQAEAMQSNPLLLLLENDQQNWQAFDVSLHTNAERQTWTIKDEQSDFGGSILELVFSLNSASEFGLTELRLKDAHGQESIFQLSNVRFNQTVAATTFALELPDGTDIDDQR